VGLPAYLDDLEPVVRDAVDKHARVSIGSFAGGSGAVRWTVMDQATDARNANPKNQERQAVSTRKCLMSLMERTLGAAPAQAGTDVLGAIRAAADWVAGGKAGKTIAVATDGLATAGCADLTRARFSGRAEIDGIVKVCLDRREVRADLLRDVDVSMIGVGRPGPDQPIASPAQLAWLESLWQGLCSAGGGRCAVKTADPGRTQGPASSPDTVPDTAVGFSTVWRFQVPGAVLFDTDKWDLRTEATALLIGIAVAIRTVPGSKVEVAGHADATGNSAHNQELSERRAAAVGEFLKANGVSNISLRGYGDTRPLCTTTPPDDQCLQTNRRVEITAEHQ
jgi:outer membrane protein OmpA-like peptidoglycan-associated protein